MEIGRGAAESGEEVGDGGRWEGDGGWDELMWQKWKKLGGN